MPCTIYALSTPFFKSAIAIIRVSGTDALTSLYKLTNLKKIAPFRFKLCTLFDSQGMMLDQPLVVYFPKNKSYTGEDMVEFHVHGSFAVIKELLSALGEISNYRLALPGEFTKRALENNKMDLIAAEGVYDLINAETSEQKNQAIKTLSGEIKNKYEALLQIIKDNLALLETSIDFSEEDIPDNLLEDINKNIFDLHNNLLKELEHYQGVKKLKQGINLTIIGSPNVGKSSLINYLSGSEVAIISEIAGTTRDIVSSYLDICGYPIIINDTAGLREQTTDPIEKEGIKRAVQAAKGSDLKLLVIDSTEIETGLLAVKSFINGDYLLLLNKLDLNQKALNNFTAAVKQLNLDLTSAVVIPLSIKQQTNTEELKNCLKNKFMEITKFRESSIIVNERHKELLQNITAHLKDFSTTEDIVLKAYHLRSSMNLLGQILGLNNIEDILDIVFAKFCIGK